MADAINRESLRAATRFLSDAQCRITLERAVEQLLATGLSRKEQWTAAYCGNCGSKWDF